MKIFHHQAETHVPAILAQIKNNRQIWRAQHFKIALLKKEPNTANIESILLGIIVDQLSDVDGYVLSCRDSDVIIVGKAIQKRNFDHIAEDLRQHLSRDPAAIIPMPAIEIFDLSVQWESFLKLCADKVYVSRTKPQTPLATATPMKPEIDVKAIKVQSAVHEGQLRLLAKGKDMRKERKKPCVLLVEDDALSLHIAKKALDQDYIVETSTNAAEAIRAYATHVPDIVFLDIGLPDSSGHDVLDEFMALDDQAFVVMLSGNSFRDDIVKAMQRGAKGFVGKPFARAKLLHYVAQSPHCAHTRPISTL